MDNGTHNLRGLFCKLKLEKRSMETNLVEMGSTYIDLTLDVPRGHVGHHEMR